MVSRCLKLLLFAGSLVAGLAGCRCSQCSAPTLPVYMSEAATPPVPADAIKLCSAAAPEQLPQPTAGALSLQEAIHLCIVANLNIQASSEKVEQARGELLQASLIPNPTLLVDTQLNPLGRPFTVQQQGGPPQEDFAVEFPIDWCLFGKRVASMEAASRGVDVAAAETANVIRVQVTETVIAFYDVLEAKALVDIAQQDLASAEKIEAATARLVKAGELAPIESDRARLLVLDARRELRRRELAVNVARARLAPLVGRCAADIDVRGDLAIAAPADIPDVCRITELAERQRPDIIALNRRIAQAEAEINRERKKGCPEVTVEPVFTNQRQADIGFFDATSYGVVLTSTLPFTDRNQGNVARAMSVQREAIVRLQAELTQMRAEVQQAVDTYQTTLEIVQRDDETMIETARRLRDRTEDAFTKGQDSLLNLVLMQRTLHERLRLAASNKADYWRALQRLNSAAGGLSELREQGAPPLRLGEAAPRE